MADDEWINIEPLEYDALLAELEGMATEIKQRLLVLVEHPGMSDLFRNDPKVKEWLR